MAASLEGRISWKEILLAVWFFAGSLEILLLYTFQAFDALKDRLSRGRWKAGRLGALIGTKAILYGLLVPFLLATFSIHRVKIPPRPPPRELGMAFEEIRFPSRGDHPISLSGWFFPLKENLGTVIACHGVGANRADILHMIWSIREAGFQVLAFDFRGHGDSDGHTITFGFREREDVLGAWDYLAARKDVDPGRIFGFGVSMGASSLLMALPDLPKLRAAVADSAYSDLRRMVRHQYRFVPEPGRSAFALLTELFGYLETGLRINEASPLKAIEGVRIPIFFIHGRDDIIVPSDCTETLHVAYKGPKDLHLEPGAGHGGTAEADLDRYRKEIRKFFLQAAGGPVRPGAN